MIRFGVVGLGFGRFIVETLANIQEAHLVCVADQNEERRKAIAGPYACRAYADAMEMLDSEDLDALCICTPPHARRELIEKAKSKNLAIFMEKPLATNTARAEELAKLLEAYTRPVMLGYSFRFLDAIQLAQEKLDKELGEPLLAIGQYIFNYSLPSEHWIWDREIGNGIINENSCHLFDIINLFLGKPAYVFADAKKFMNKPLEDAGAAIIGYENGATASLTFGGIGANGRNDFPSLTIYTRKGFLELRGKNHIWESLRWGLRDSEEVQEFTTNPEFVGRTRYSKALEHFIGCINQNSSPEVGIPQGILTNKIADAIYAAVTKGQKIRIY